MIPLGELSPGNLILGIYEDDDDDESSEQVEVVLVDPTKEITDNEIWVDGTKEHYNDFEPIPLTEEWLIKWQLPKRKLITQNTKYDYSIRNDFEIYCYIDESGYCQFYAINSFNHHFFIIKCDTVHTFQNIYAVLNPHEKLTIKK